MVNSVELLPVRTREIPVGEDLLDFLPEADGSSCWLRDGEGLVGWGVAARIDTAGPERFTDAARRWHRLAGRMDVDDEVGLPGTGPVAFAGIAFADEPGESTLIVPRVVVGQRNGTRWITRIGDAEPPPRTPVEPPGTVRYCDGRLPVPAYREAVAEAVRQMRNGCGFDKVVLAHDLLASTSEPLDPRFLLRNLVARYPNCWTFAVDGLVGATPELLLERSEETVRARVLAGTSWPRDGLGHVELAAELMSSAKNRHEHAYAIESLAATLRPFCGDLTVPAEPEVLRLRNVIHLASDVSGTLCGHNGNGRASLLRLAEAVHPTAAVGGTPRAEAVRAIGELEGMDRGRYAGPVGWLDGEGNGELGLALRCAQIGPGTPSHGAAGRHGTTARLFAGCGIVADSDPDREVAEAAAKLLPMREALEGVR